jgi:hypothetical protein
MIYMLMGLYLSSVLHWLCAHESSNFQCQTHTILLIEILDLSVMYEKICEITIHQNREALSSESICSTSQNWEFVLQIDCHFNCSEYTYYTVALISSACFLKRTVTSLFKKNKTHNKFILLISYLCTQYWYYFHIPHTNLSESQQDRPCRYKYNNKVRLHNHCQCGKAVLNILSACLYL